MAELIRVLSGLRNRALAIPLLCAALAVAWPAYRNLALAKAKVQADEPSQQSGKPPAVFKGVTSCSAAACHNGQGDDLEPRNEYAVWVNRDRHARAYATLLTRQARLIVKNLDRFSSLDLARPEQDSRCLTCHATWSPGIDLDLVQDGVSCESCHGASGNWLAVHYTRPFKEYDDGAKERVLGMRQTKDLRTRARLCLECHAGSVERAIDHDLFAAGHPPLYAEFSSLMANMPRHWDEQKARTADPHREIRIWAVGQLVSAQLALERLERRAGHSAAAWPELAEYSCFSCHHDLQAGSRRQAVGHLADRRPGSLIWGRWFMPGLPSALRILDADARSAAEGLARLDRIRKVMEGAAGDRALVRSEARQAVRGLDNGLDAALATVIDSDKIAALIDSIRQQDRLISESDWEGKVQVYLMLSAFFHGGAHGSGLDKPALERELRERVAKLRLKPGLDSPRGFGEPRSPEPAPTRSR